MKNLDGKLILGLSLSSVVLAIIFVLQLATGYIRSESRKAAADEIEYRLGQHGTLGRATTLSVANSGNGT